MPELLGSPTMWTVPAGSWNWQTAWERSRNDYLPVRASGKMQKVMGYCQVVKAQDFDSCIPGSSPGSLVGDFWGAPRMDFSIVLVLLSPLAESWLKSRRKARWGFRFCCGSFLGVKEFAKKNHSRRFSRCAAHWKIVSVGSYVKGCKMHMSVAQAYAILEHSSVVELPAYIRRVPGSIPGVPIF